LSVFLFGGSRLMVRSLSEHFIGAARLKNGGPKEAVILGAGDSGHLMVKLLQNAPHIPYVPAVVLDDLERLAGSYVYGVKVQGGLFELGRILAERPELVAVLIAIPTLSAKKMAEVRAVCAAHNVAIKKLQSFEDIACLDLTSELQELNIETVLQKETSIEREEEVQAALMGRRVLVTGAGGSIGSELVRQIVDFSPSSLLLVDSCEFNLYQIERELRAAGKADGLSFIVADIGERGYMRRLLAEHVPEFVFHAAAYKHVPLMEANCYQAFRNNVLGTRNLHDECAAAGVKKFVFISSDKAVDPTSVMGCSKKIGELFIQYQSQHSPLGSKMQSTAVRFGNVINSAGSVVPLFKEQIANGGPITITHPDMERYFMSIREAVRLVLTAGALGENGQIYVLDMGKKIKIVDLAFKMLKLYGRRDIGIIYTGLRPGEKLTEDLLTSYEKLATTSLRKVSRLVSRLPNVFNISEWIDSLESRAAELDNEEIGRAMKALVDEIESAALRSKVDRVSGERAFAL